MTEAEWLNSIDPLYMFDQVADSLFHFSYQDDEPISRKPTLFVAACCRLLWPLIVEDQRVVRALEFQENQFDQIVTNDDAAKIWSALYDVTRALVNEIPDEVRLAATLVNCSSPWTTIAMLVRSFNHWGDVQEREAQIANIMRDILGNPFRPITISPAWRTSNVLTLVETIYANRQHELMPILGDALMDAGCEDEQILNHCRQTLPHVHGCWLIDLVLGKG